MIAGAILFYMALRFLPGLRAALAGLLKILSPFIWGFVITYLIAPLMKLLDKHVFGPLCARIFRKSKKKNGKKLARALSVVVSELVLLGVLTGLGFMIIPQLAQSIEDIVNSTPIYFDKIRLWAIGLLENNPDVEAYANTLLEALNDDIVNWAKNTVLPSVQNIAESVTTGAVAVLIGIYNLLIGIVVSIYVLSDLEHFTAGGRRLIYSVFRLETAEKLREAISFTDRTFMGFITGKLLDSAIIGLICYIGCAIMGIKESLLVGVIVGVTNVIPFFGPFIGGVPSALIILMGDSALQCLMFIVFVIVLQQVDGNIIGPKILGSSIGITSFWVLFAIVLGSGLFGFWGMLLGVPVFVVIYTFLNKLIEDKLKRRDLPPDTEEYVNLDHIDPITRLPVKNELPLPEMQEKPNETPETPPQV
jgi:predicted PurR-regulated permease PerM